MPVFGWKAWETPRKAYEVGIPAEIRTGYSPNKNLGALVYWYQYNDIAYYTVYVKGLRKEALPGRFSSILHAIISAWNIRKLQLFNSTY
jgi:hypothetical protein